MKILKIIGIVILSLIVVIVVFMWYVGALGSVVIEEKMAGGYKFAGVDFVGPYQNVGPSMDKVDKDLRAMGIECTKGFGVYFDNPQETPKEKCRSFVGNIIEEKDFGRLEEIKTKGFKIDSLVMAQALVIEYPVKTTLSYMLGPIKAYPAFDKYMKEKKYTATASVEVYDMPNKKIFYIMQYSK